MNTYRTYEKVIRAASTSLFFILLLILCLPESYTSWCIPVSPSQKMTEKMYDQVSVCLLLMSVSGLLIFIYWGKRKWILLNLTMILFILFLVEEFYLLKQTKAVSFQPKETPGFYTSDTALAYHLIKNPLKEDFKIRASCRYNDTLLLYDNVRYTLDENGQRITAMPSSKYDSSKQSIAFLGCSFTFGIGVNDEETLPFNVQNELPNTKVYNFGVSGYGPNQVLRQIEIGTIDSMLKQPPRAFIFSTIQDHLRRLEDPDRFNISGPKYAINEKTGELEYKGHFNDPENSAENKFFSKIKKSSFINALTGRQVAKRRAQLLVAHILKIRDLLLKRYPNAPFHLIYWYVFTEDIDRDIVKSLREAKINLHVISHIIPDYYDEFPNLVVRFPYEFHPSTQANRQIARYVVDRIIKKDEYYENNALAFTDDFDSIAGNTWYPVEFSLPENNCDMRASQVKYADGKAKITMAVNDSLNSKPFVSGGINSLNYFRYGRFTVSLKANLAPGSFAYMELMNLWRPEFWEHRAIEIYFRGENPHQVTFSVKSFKMDHEDPREVNKLYNLDFDASKGFHNYAIDWSKDSISFLIDDTVAFTEKNITWDDEMNISLSHWTASSEGGWLLDWLGKFDKSKLPSVFEVDHFSYQPPKKTNESDAN